MAVMEVNLPSGFTANMDSLPALRRYKGVKRVDTEKSDTKVVLYFETLTRSEVCPTFSAFRTHRVAKQGCDSVEFWVDLARSLLCRLDNFINYLYFLLYYHGIRHQSISK